MTVDDLTDDAVAAKDATEEMVQRLAEGGIQAPPRIPALARPLRQQGDIAFGTRDLAAPLYEVGVYMNEFVNGEVEEDYLAVGVDGYGMHSFYFHFYLVQGAFALFLQLPVQGPDGDDKASIAAINARLDAVEVLMASPPVGPLAIIDVIDLKAIMKGSSVGQLTMTRAIDPLAQFLSDRAARDGEAVILNL